MRYIPYGELDGIPNVIVDGSPHADTVLTLSHWPGTPTPAALKDDLSAQIAFHYLDRADHHVSADVVSNNHVDQDGLVSMYALVEPDDARRRRDQLVDLARAGDFATFATRDSARIAWTIAELAGNGTGDGAGYPELLERLPELLDHPERYRALWADEDAHLAATEAGLADGSITITEHPDEDLDLAVVTIPVGWPRRPSHRFTRIGTSVVHPAAIHNATDRFTVVYRQGMRYEVVFRYETWVQYMSRRPRARVDLTPLAEELTEGEPGDARWTFDGVGDLEPALQLAGADASTLGPDDFIEGVTAFLRAAPAAWDPYG